jgi:hypothetical protein
MKHHHICSLAFDLISDDENGTDLTPEMYRIAIKEKVDRLDRFDLWSSGINIIDAYPKREELES